MLTKICTKCSTTKDLTDFTKAKLGKLGRKAECKTCQAVRYKEHYDKNQEAMQQRTREYTACNPEKAKEATRKYRVLNTEKIKIRTSIQRKAAYLLNKEKVIARNKAWRNENPDTLKRLREEYRVNNPDKMANFSASSRASRTNSKPPWLTKQDKEDIRSLYTLRNQIMKDTGDIYHVDHIIPLRNSLVCGLHVPWNLQVILAKDNLRKSNKFDLEDYNSNNS